MPNDAGDEDFFDPETEDVPPLETPVRPRKPKPKNDKVEQKQKVETEGQNVAGKEDASKPVQGENQEQGHMGDAQAANDVLKTEGKEEIDSSSSKEEELKKVFKNEEEDMLDKLTKQVLENSESRGEQADVESSKEENKDHKTKKDGSESQLSEAEEMLQRLKVQALTNQKRRDEKVAGPDSSEANEENVGRKTKEENKGSSSSGAAGIMLPGEAVAPGAKIDTPVMNVSPVNDAPGNDPPTTVTDQKKTVPESSPQLDDDMAGLDPTSHSAGGVNFDEEMQKLPNFRIIKESHIRDYLAKNYAGKDVNEETMKEVDAFIVSDMLKQLKEPDNDLLHMLLHYSEKDLLETANLTVEKPEGTDEKKDSEKKEDVPKEITETAIGEGKTAGDAPGTDVKEASTSSEKEEGAVGREVPDSKAAKDAESVKNAETKDAVSNIAGARPAAAALMAPDIGMDKLDSTGKRQEEQVASADVDYTKHPNFEALKQKQIDNYLGLHYSPEEVTPQLLRTVEKFVTDDLSRQLKNADNPLIDELLGKKVAIDVQETVEKNVENEKEHLESDKKEEAREIKVIQDSVVSETSEHSKAEIETLPVPPAGGKDATKPHESSIHEPQDVGKDTETSGDSKAEEEKVSGSNVEDVIAKASEPVKAAEDDQVTKDEGDKSAESTKEESAKTPGKFLFKKIGNALKDRFKAFASKMMASSQEGKSGEGGSTSEAGESGESVESDSRSENDSAGSDDVRTTKDVTDQGARATEAVRSTDKEELLVADISNDEDSKAKLEELERQGEADRQLEERKKDTVTDEVKQAEDSAGTHDEIEEARGGKTSDDNLASLAASVPASSYIQDGDHKSSKCDFIVVDHTRSLAFHKINHFLMGL